MRIGVDPHPMSEDGKKVANLVWDAIDKGNLESARKAVVKYDSLLSKEGKTNDYSPLKWLCETMVASDDEKKTLIDNDLAEDYFQFFTDSNYVHLKEYLLRKYKINNYSPKDPDIHLMRRTFLEDLLMFNNPRRNDWENSDEILKHIPLKEGDKVMDIGCGFGYYAYRFSKKVGKSGKVYAVDTDDKYIKYLNNFVKKYNVDNMLPVTSKNSDVCVNDVADVAFMSSVYHIIYGWAQEKDRSAFLNTLKKSLRKDGLLIIADNSFQNGNELNNCYIDKNLVIAQLIYNGFEFKEYVQITPQRYLLIFRHRPGKNIKLITEKPIKGQKKFILNITTGNSIVHIGSLDSYDITPEGIASAKLVLRAIEGKDPDTARMAIESYDKIIPRENFGGEYTALQWFCEYLISNQQRQDSMLQDPLTRAFYNYLSKDNYRLIKEFVKYKYHLSPEQSREEENKTMTEEDREIGRTRRAFLEDFILFDNPKREEWEKTSKIMQSLEFKKGDVIADFGCGSGYYTYKFSKLVGDEGKVYAIDIKDGHLNFLNDFVKEQNINNIQTVKAKNEDINLQAKVDYVFMCSLYHIIYGVYSEPDRTKLIESIRNVLKPTGKLVIVDNGPVSDQQLPYHGPYITKELIEYQLAYYGFVLEKYEQIIPQRYMLTFRLE